MNGRDKSPEQEAQDIMNQSDEGMDDLLQGTELPLDDEDLGGDSDLFSDMGLEDSDNGDDGGDFTDF